MIDLKGITWNHTRGLLPMLATAQHFEETHPDVRLRWEKRSLQAFADSAGKLEAEYKVSANEYKSSLPAEAKSALESAGKQLKGLRPLLN